MVFVLKLTSESMVPELSAQGFHYLATHIGSGTNLPEAHPHNVNVPQATENFIKVQLCEYFYVKMKVNRWCIPKSSWVYTNGKILFIKNSSIGN